MLVIAISDSRTPEVTLRLKDDHGEDAHLPGRLMGGAQIRFQGKVTEFTADPFMLTFEVSTGRLGAPNSAGGGRRQVR